MDLITREQHVKYEQILQQTEDEWNVHESLKKDFNNLTNNITVMKILSKKEFACNKIFQVKVKLFNNIFDLFETFGDNINNDDINTLRICNKCKFYYVEIFISRLFDEKLIAQNWLLNLTVYNENSKVSKILKLKNRYTNPVASVLPMDFEFVDTETYVAVDLVSVLENSQFWPSFNLKTIHVDVSYHFDKYQYKTENQIEQQILNINECHNKETIFKEIKPNLKTYKFQCNWTYAILLEAVLKNSYHKMNLSNCCNTLDNIITFKILINQNKVLIELDTSDKKLSVVGSYKDLFLIKKYFLIYSNLYEKENFAGITSKFKDLQHDLENELSQIRINQSNIANIYEEYFKCIEKFPLYY